MSIQGSYKILGTPNPNAFMFKSIGDKGEIWKVVLFQSELKKGNFNLAFGDLVDNDIDDKVVSNNNDLLMVISTVVKIVYYFFEIHPNATIEIKGVDKKRSKLYNSIFKRRWKEIAEKFEVRGFTNKKWENYRTEEMYEIFEIKLKK